MCSFADIQTNVCSVVLVKNRILCVAHSDDQIWWLVLKAHRAWRKATPPCKASRFATHMMQASGDWQEVIQDPSLDAVVIGVWPYLHRTLVLEALQAGKHVLTEARLVSLRPQRFSSPQPYLCIILMLKGRQAEDVVCTGACTVSLQLICSIDKVYLHNDLVPEIGNKSFWWAYSYGQDELWLDA